METQINIDEDESEAEELNFGVFGVWFRKVSISRPDTMVSSSIAQLKIVIEQVLLSKISRDLSPILSSFQK